MARLNRIGWAGFFLVMALITSWHANAEAIDVYILTGQSNALGTTRYDGGEPADYGPGKHKTDQKVELFWSNVHSSNMKHPPKLYGDSGEKIVPIRMQQGDGKDNPAFWGPEFGLARKLAEKSDHRILIIKASRGGGGNGYWDKATFEKDKHAGHMYPHLCDTVDAGLEALSKRGDTFTVKALLYVQGESNSVEEANAAGSRLGTLHQNLREHINQQHAGKADAMKLVIGEIAASESSAARQATTEQQQTLAQSEPAIAFVPSRDLPLQPDQIHFGKDAKLILGNRMAQAVHRLELTEEQRRLTKQAQDRLVAWRKSGDGDVAGQRPLIITLFTGSDTEPAPQYRERLTRTMKHIQAFYASEMQRHGFGPLTFQMQMRDDDLLDIHVVQGDRPNAEYTGKDGQAIRKVVLKHLENKGINGSKETVVIFCNLTKWDPKARRMSHHSPYYAGGSHQSGTAWQLDSALLDVAEIGNTDKARFLHDGQYGHISLGRYQSIFVGGVCHELGHALGLPHNKQRPEEGELRGTALMGSGNRTYGEEVRNESKGSFLTLAHAMKLAAHPGFTGSVKQMRKGPKTRYTELTLTPTQADKAVRIEGRIEGDIPVHAVIAYLDPEGHGDYNATTHVAVPDDDGRFVLDCNSFVGKSGRVRLVRVHANGWSRFKEDLGMDYERGEDGKVQVAQPVLGNKQSLIGPPRVDGMAAAAVHPGGYCEDCASALAKPSRSK